LELDSLHRQNLKNIVTEVLKFNVQNEFFNHILYTVEMKQIRNYYINMDLISTQCNDIFIHE
jgi:hypothetical protein